MVDETKKEAGWRLINTAPKNDSRLLLWFPDGCWQIDEGEHIAIGFWSTSAENWFQNECDSNSMTAFVDEPPTYWMPLPEPPEAS